MAIKLGASHCRKFGSKFEINRFPICLSLPLLLAIVANKSVTSAAEF